MLINLFDTLSELCLNDSLLLVDFLSSFSLDKWVILFGAKDRARSKVLPSRCMLDLRIVCVCASWRSTSRCLASQFFHFGFLKLLAVDFVERVVEYYLASDRICIIDLLLLVGKGFPWFRDGSLKSFFCDIE